MWKKLVNTDHFLQLGENLEICITDFISIWRIQFSEASFLACLKDSNFGLEINENVLVQKGRLMLNNPERLKSVRLKEDGKTLLVTLAMSFGFPLRLEMNLTEGSKELFYKKITLQLLNTIQDLHTSQTELRKSLLKKDSEIEQYKSEKGGEIALRFLKTTPYNDESHMVQHPVYSEYFGCEDVPDCLLSKSVDVPEMHAVNADPSVSNVKKQKTNGTANSLKTETPNIKSGPTSVKTEETVHTESVTSSKQETESVSCIKQEVKSETTDSESVASIKEEVKSEPFKLSPSRLRARPGVAGPSPKRNKRRLNL